MNQNQCKTCKYYDNCEGRGECHRYPPSHEVDMWSEFPSPGADNWCGEWKRRAKEEAMKSE